MSEQEPRDVKVARALGWPSLRHWPQIEPVWGSAWVYSSERGTAPVPDFACDAAWVVRTIEENRLDTRSAKDHAHVWCGIISASGPTLGEAVCAWVIAAHEAGIEVKQ